MPNLPATFPRFRFHELPAEGGGNGVAMSWSCGLLARRAIVVAARQGDGTIGVSCADLGIGAIPRAGAGTGAGSLREGLEMVVAAFTGPGPVAADTDRARRRARARSFLEGADIPGPMRLALHALMDHGVPHCVEPVANAIRHGAAPGWEMLAHAAANPLAAGLAIKAAPARRRWGRGRAVTDARVGLDCLDEARLRRLRAFPDGGRRALATVTDGKAADAALRALSALPPEWIPDDAGWDAFLAVARACAAIVGGGELPVLPLLSPGRGGWEAHAARLAASFPPHDGRQEEMFDDFGVEEDDPTSWLLGRARDARDPVESLSESLVLPLMHHVASGPGEAGRRFVAGGWAREATLAAERLLYGGRSLHRVLAVSRDWHERAAAIADASATGGAAAWPPLLAGPFSHGAVEVVPLMDADALAAEGDPGTDREGVPGLDHCIASRLPRLASGASHALSVRVRHDDGTWSRLSTLQVRVEGGRIVAEEHRGRGNRDAPREARAAVAALADAVATGAVALEARALDPRSRPATDRVADACRYDWHDPHAVANAADAWSPLLPRWARGLAPDALLAAMVSHGVLPGDWTGQALRATLGFGNPKRVVAAIGDEDDAWDFL